MAAFLFRKPASQVHVASQVHGAASAQPFLHVRDTATVAERWLATHRRTPYRRTSGTSHNSFADALPEDLCLQVLKHLSARDLCAVGAVNRAFRRLALSKTLWKWLCKRTWRRSWWGPQSMGYTALAESLENDWRAIYISKCVINTRWATGDCRVITFEGHSARVDAVQFDDAKIVSASEDGSVAVWDVRTGQMARHHRHFTSMVVAMQYAEGVAILGLWDGTLVELDLDSGALGRTWVGHTAGVRCLQFARGLLVSGSFDGTLRVWDLHTGACLNVLAGHQAGISGLAFDAELLVSCDMAGALCVWSCATGDCVARVEHPLQHAFLSVALSATHIVVGSESGDIYVYDRRTLSPLAVLEGHTAAVNALALGDDPDAGCGRLVSASTDGTLRLWSMGTLSHTVTLLAPGQHDVTAVSFDDNRIVAGGGDRDNAVRVYDFAYNLQVDPRAIMHNHGSMPVTAATTTALSLAAQVADMSLGTPVSMHKEEVDDGGVRGMLHSDDEGEDADNDLDDSRFDFLLDADEGVGSGVDDSAIHTSMGCDDDRDLANSPLSSRLGPLTE